MERQTGHEVVAILVDRNIEGPAVMLWGTLAAGGWLELLPMTMARFTDVGLPFDSRDRTVWRFAQEHGMLLLTDNRSRRGEDSLEQTIARCTPPRGHARCDTVAYAPGNSAGYRTGWDEAGSACHGGATRYWSTDDQRQSLGHD